MKTFDRSIIYLRVFRIHNTIFLVTFRIFLQKRYPFILPLIFQYSPPHIVIIFDFNEKKKKKKNDGIIEIDGS